MNLARFLDIRSIHKMSVIFLYTSNNQTESKNLKYHFKIKYLGINLTKSLQGFYTENYKTILRDLKKT